MTCDIRPSPSVDYVCDACELPFGNESVDEIFSRHLIEHFTLREFLKVLQEWNRVLKTGGKVHIICPNLLWHLEQILQGTHQSFWTKESGENHRYWGFGSLFGWQQDEYDVHKFGYYFELLKEVLEDFGFGEIEDMTNHPNSLEKAPWHLEVKGLKVKRAVHVEESRFFNHFDVKH